MLLKLNNSDNMQEYENIIKCLDMGLLLGAPLTENENLLTQCASLISRKINALSNRKLVIDGGTRGLKRNINTEPYNKLKARELDRITLPSIEDFYKNYMMAEKPVVILGKII